MIERVAAWRIAPFVVAAVCSGCGESKPAGTVSGVLTLDGEHVSAGNKIFFEQSRTGVIAGGVVENEGAYALNYMGSPEIPLGDYVVFVGPVESNMSEKEYYELKAKVDADFRRRGKRPPPSPDWVLPVQYYESRTSPLRATVEEGENVINVDLEE